KARFDSPPVQLAGQGAGAPQQVLASRENPVKKFDQLLSNRLDLQLRKKAALAGPKDGPADPNSTSKEVESAVATVRPGQEVYLAMDTQNLEAYGNELYYNCAEPGHGPKTRLIGNSMRANRDGNKIKAFD